MTDDSKMGSEISDQMRAEYRAWRAFIAELEEMTERDLNDHEFKPMFNALNRWGEELVQLRLSQRRSVVDKALRDTRQLYPIPELDKGDEE